MDIEKRKINSLLIQGLDNILDDLVENNVTAVIRNKTIVYDYTIKKNENNEKIQIFQIQRKVED